MKSTSDIETTEPLYDGTSTRWHGEISELLAKAAITCVENDVDVDTFMRGAWNAYVEARPGMQERIDALQDARHLAYVRHQRRRGRL